MRIICVDDENLILQLTVTMCREIPGVDDAAGFSRCDEVLTYLAKNRADIALLDIDMPEMSGLMLAAEIKKIQPDIVVIFLTGYSQFAYDAFQLHASGYLLKPVSKEKLKAEIQYALKLKNTALPSGVKIQTFGNFEITVGGEAVSFGRSKSKELLAYLIDRQGASVSRSEAFTTLWESGTYDRSRQKQLDVIIRSLKDTLNQYGISDILEIKSGIMRIVPEKVDCDLYRFLNGDISAVNAYRGEYMSSYPWADMTEAYMTRIKNNPD